MNPVEEGERIFPGKQRVWRKMQQAQTNMLRLIRKPGRQNRHQRHRLRYWAMRFRQYLDQLHEEGLS